MIFKETNGRTFESVGKLVYGRECSGAWFDIGHVLTADNGERFTLYRHTAGAIVKPSQYRAVAPGTYADIKVVDEN